MSDEAGRIFRNAWIAGVKRHYPGEPKPGYVAAWEDTPDWERASASAVHRHVIELLQASDGAARLLTREQKGQYVAVCWVAQIYRHFRDPKPAYVAPWNQMPRWQQETDADIFEHIESMLPPRGN
ncbi:hypothetical protein [Cryptosporangium sp. NPDC048952]|uniref:hypothetical protein n=1 Tax=Cryptosporangium sp. NPDC048952 TaxID=3363961 RepID=UPI0037153AAA